MVIAARNQAPRRFAASAGCRVAQRSLRQGAKQHRYVSVMRVPRIPPSVSYISAVASVLVIPYYFVSHQPDTAWAMGALAALNFASGWWKL